MFSSISSFHSTPFNMQNGYCRYRSVQLKPLKQMSIYKVFKLVLRGYAFQAFKESIQVLEIGIYIWTDSDGRRFPDST